MQYICIFHFLALTPSLLRAAFARHFLNNSNSHSLLSLNPTSRSLTHSVSAAAVVPAFRPNCRRPLSLTLSCLSDQPHLLISVSFQAFQSYTKMGFQMPSHGIQSMLKEGHKHFSGLDEAVLKNIDACKQLSTITRTSLGPNGTFPWILNPTVFFPFPSILWLFQFLRCWCCAPVYCFVMRTEFSLFLFHLVTRALRVTGILVRLSLVPFILYLREGLVPFLRGELSLKTDGDLLRFRSDNNSNMSCWSILAITQMKVD